MISAETIRHLRPEVELIDHVHKSRPALWWEHTRRQDREGGKDRSFSKMSIWKRVRFIYVRCRDLAGSVQREPSIRGDPACQTVLSS